MGISVFEANNFVQMALYCPFFSLNKHYIDKAVKM